MTALELRARNWASAACAVAQIAATAAGMVPWWALPVTLTLTMVVSRPPGPVNPIGSRVTRSAGVACVAAFAALIAVHSVAAGGVGADPVTTLRSLSEALVVLSLLIAPTARTSREHRVWLTVTTGILVAAAAGGHSLSCAGLDLLSWVVLLVAIAKVQITAAYADGAVIATVTGPAPKPAVLSMWQTDSVVPVLAALAAGTVVFYALPGGLGGGDLARRIATQVGGNSDTGNETRENVGVDTFGSGDLSLLVRGQLPDTPLLRVPLSSPTLWRGTIYRDYTGSSWEDGVNDQFVSLNGPSVAIPTSTDDPPANGHSETDRAQIVDGNIADLIWAPGVITHLSGRRDQIQRIFRSANNVRAYGQPLHPLRAYTVTSTVAPSRPAELSRAAGGADPADPVWTQLPPTLPTAVSQLAHRITASATNRYQQVTDLERYLRANETYSQNSPVPGAGQDAVGDFLLRDHVGFCEQFASAEAVMLRTLGVPARVVTGLAGGIRTGDARLYTAADAHAWVEVYYPGVGWSPTDPTAGVQLAPAAADHSSVVSRALRAIAAALPGGRLTLGVLTAALLVLACWLFGALGSTSRRRSARRGPAPSSGPVLAAFLRMTRHRRVPAPRAAPETAREYLGRVSPPGTATAPLATLEQEMYGAAPPEEPAVVAAVAAFDSLVD
jgi:transglutaminase-like putative cysteine protease